MWVTDTCWFKIKNLKEMLEMLMCLELACAHNLLPPPAAVGEAPAESAPAYY